MKTKKEELKAIIYDIGGVLQVGEQQRKYQSQKHASGVHESIAKKLRIRMDQYFDSIDTAYALSIEGKISKRKLFTYQPSSPLKTPKNCRTNPFFSSIQHPVSSIQYPVSSNPNFCRTNPFSSTPINKKQF